MYTFTALFVASHLQSASLLILNLLLVHLVKGVLWPSLGSIAFQSIHLETVVDPNSLEPLVPRRAVGDLLLGQLLKWGFTWRSALYLYGGFAGTSSMENYGAKWRRLSGDLNGWLALGVLVGSNCIWSLGYGEDGGDIFDGANVTSGRAEDTEPEVKFDLSPGAAAQAASSLLGGTFLGLLSAGLVTFFQGRVLGRRLQLLQAGRSYWPRRRKGRAEGGLGAVLMLVAMPKLSLLPWVLGLLVTGASAGPLLYLPYCVYSASVPRTHRAFSMGILDSMSTATTCGTRILFGRLRIALPSSAGLLARVGCVNTPVVTPTSPTKPWCRFTPACSGLARALAELTPDGSALSQEALEERVEVVKAAGKCWSVDSERAQKRAKAATA
eukprot:g12017.t1